MQIELKNLKHYERMSEETFCFHATLYVDGKKIGEVQNDGKGGQHRYGFNFVILDGLEARARALPPHEDLQMNLDFLISLKVEEALKAKDAAKLEKKYQQKADKAKSLGLVFAVMEYGDFNVLLNSRPENLAAAREAQQEKNGREISFRVY